MAKNYLSGRRAVGFFGLVLALCLATGVPARGGLVAHYGFEDFWSPGTVQDTAGGHDGTVYGANYTFDSRVGLAAMAFDGASDVRTPYSPDFGLSTYSISAWVKIGVEQGNGGILGTRFGGDTTFDVKVRSTDIHGDVGSGSGWINTGVDIRPGDTGSNGQGGDLAHDQWYLVTYVIDDAAKQFRLYLDADLKRTIGYTGTPLLMKPGQEMRLGNSYATEYLNGLLDDVRIYDHALSQDEIAALALPQAVQFSPITNLFNTGVDDSGVALVGGHPGNPVTDPHYDVIEFAGSAVTPFVAYAAEDDNFPIPPWVANDADSRWIDPVGVENSMAPPGRYVYRTAFTLPDNAILDSVTIDGYWGTDDPGLDILVNGLSSGNSSSGFGSLSYFRLTDGFVHGQNTLDLVVRNAGTGPNPTGLRVDDIRGVYKVPEPTTAVLFSAIVALGLGRRRRARRGA